MKKRDLYLNELLKFKNKNIIKVITGIRRCGKSSLLKLFRNH
ncbi:MAG: ATPase, partial [Fusobacteriaceae bacterium]